MKAKRTPQRTCIGCRKVLSKRELLRIVRGTDGTIFFDPSGKANGRGTYVCPKLECLKSAFASKRLSRALDVEISADDLNRIKKELEAMLQ
jgi:uncharacterized protein